MLRLFVCVAFAALLTTTPAAAADAFCCRKCCKGKACGNACIAKWMVCSKQPGCACDKCPQPAAGTAQPEPKEPSVAPEGSKGRVHIVKNVPALPRATRSLDMRLNCLEEFLSQFRR